MRITRPQMFMEIAQVVAKRSTCMRLNVGAVLVKDRTIVSIGYNGVPKGQPHCAGNDCAGKFGCNLTVHAEVNALDHCSVGNPYSLDLYCTDSPCLACTHRLDEDRRVNRIFFGTPYRINDHLEHLKNMQVYRVLPAGYVLDWRTKELVDVVT